MARTETSSVRTSIHVAMATVIVVLVLAAGALHEAERAREASRSRASGAVGIAWMAAQRLRAASLEGGDQLRRACEEVIAHPRVEGICVWGGADRVMLAAGSSPRMREWLTGRLPTRTTDSVVQSMALPDGLAETCDIILIESDLGPPLGADQPTRFCLACRADHDFGGRFGDLASFHVPLFAVGLTSLLIGGWWLRRSFVRPLLSLLRSVSSDRRSREAEQTLAERNDELGAIARSLSELQADISQWRDRAEHIERRIDSQVATKTVAIMRDMKRIQREALRDPLTGISNRRLLDERFSAIFAAQREAAQDLSVVMLDLDNFKLVNDVLGHAEGDKVLACVGELLRQCIRANDVAVRYGGDEFLLLLPGTSARAALDLAKRITALFGQQIKTMLGLRPLPSLSAGVASLRHDHPANAHDLIDLADQALYSAKQAGKNRVVLRENP